MVDCLFFDIVGGYWRPDLCFVHVPQWQQYIAPMLEGQPDESEPQKRNQIYRLSLRRNQLEAYFQQRREELMAAASSEQLERLKNANEQQDFLLAKGRELAGEPSEEWVGAVRELKSTVTAFQGDFNFWVSPGIVASLVSVLRPEYRSLTQLRNAVLDLFCDMVYAAYERKEVFVSKLLEYQPIPNIVDIGDDERLTLQQRLMAMALLTNIAICSDYYRFQVIRDGGGVLMVSLGADLLALPNGFPPGLMHEYLKSGVLLMRSMENKPKSKDEFSVDLNLLQSYLTVLLRLMELEITNDLQVVVFNTIGHIFKSNRKILFSNVFNHTPTMESAFLMLTNSSLETRLAAVYFFSSLSSWENPNICRELIRLRLLDLLFECYQKPNSQQLDNLTVLLAITLGNLGTERVTAEAIVSHGLMGVLVELMAHPVERVSDNALFSLDTILSCLRYQQLEDAVHKYDILKYVTKGLLDSYHPDILKDLLRILISIIETSKETYVHQLSPLVRELCSIYDIEAVLQRINSKNTMVVETSLMIQDYLAQASMEHLPSI